MPTYLKVLCGLLRKSRVPRNLHNCEQDGKIDVQRSRTMRAAHICAVALYGNGWADKAQVFLLYLRPLEHLPELDQAIRRGRQPKATSAHH